MSKTRRAILATGGAAIAVAGAGWALTRDPKKARAPWAQAGESFGDARLDALAYAILAPNPHNMQPWRVKLDGEDGFHLYADLNRMLPQTDPQNRQITIGLGAFLELFRQAAAEKEYRAEIAPFPDGEPQPVLDARPIAYVRLQKDASVAREPLFGGALHRRTNRNPFDASSVDKGALQRLRAASVSGVDTEYTVDAGLCAELRRIARDAWRIEWELARTRRESIAVTRIGKKAIDAEPWGLALPGPLLEGLSAAGILTPEKLDAAGTPAYDQALSTYEKSIESAGAFAWSTTRGNMRRDQLDVGSAWVRMQLAAQKERLAFHPLSQALQEFPEMAEPYRRIHALLAPDGGTVQMLVRIGRAKDAPAAPREALTSKIIPA